jgi:glutamine synthetase
VTPAERVDVRVPRAWLEPGRYRVEVRSAGAEAEIDVFTFAVDG